MSDEHPGPWRFDGSDTWEWRFRDANGKTVIGGEGHSASVDKTVIAMVESAPEMLALLRDVGSTIMGWSCGDLGAVNCEAGVDGPCWGHRRRALLARIDGATAPAPTPPDPLADGYQVLEVSHDGKTWVEAGERAPLTWRLGWPANSLFRYVRQKVVKNINGSIEVTIGGAREA
jgi:hypothetical protein